MPTIIIHRSQAFRDAYRDYRIILDYRGACCPSHFVFDDFDDYEDYMRSHAQPGDAFDIWALGELLSGIGTLAEGKFPDDDGAVPRMGAY